MTSKKPALLLFLIGQSIGGTIALDYVLREAPQLQGLILMSPGLRLGVTAWKLWLAQLLSLLWSHLALDSGLDLGTSSRVPEIVAACAQDPLRHSQGTARLTTELLKTMDCKPQINYFSP